MMKKIFIACLFCLLFTGGISYSQDICDGDSSITIDRFGKFVLCWVKNPEPDVQGYLVRKSRIAGEIGDEFLTVLHANCLERICETPPLIVSEVGTHYFKIYAYDANTTSGRSNEVLLIVEDGTPNPPSGCSVKKFLP